MNYQELKFVVDNEIKAVNYKDIKEYLTSINEYEYVIKGKAKCSFCNKRMTLDNIYSVYPDNEKQVVKYCCSKLTCVMKLTELKKAVK